MRILIVEDSEDRLNWFRYQAIGIPTDIAKTAKEGLEFLSKNEYTQIFLDHDLADHHYVLVFKGLESDVYDEETGFAVAKFLAENPTKSPEAQIIVHSLNEYASGRMMNELKKAGRRPLRIPFSNLKTQYAHMGRKERSIYDY